MSDLELHSLLCDFGETCETEPPFVSSSLAITREQAAKVGWTHPKPGVDLCPEHSPKEKQ